MRRAAFILGVFLVLPLVAGFDYSTVLYTEDLNEDFTISGWAVGDQVEQGARVEIKYTITFIDDSYNRTTVTPLVFRLVNETHILGADGTGGIELDRYGSDTGFITIETDVRPEEIQEVAMRANHTAVLPSGKEVVRRVKGDFDFQINASRQDVMSAVFNQSTAFRGQRLSLNVSTRYVSSLTVDGVNLKKGDQGLFTGPTQLPVNLSLGEHAFPYTFVTGRGNTFTHNLSVTIVNRQPRVTVRAPEKVKRPEPFTVQVDAVDDTGVSRIAFRFQDRRWENRSGGFTVNTSRLALGTYNYSVTVVDTEDAVVTVNDSVVVSPTETVDLDDGVGSGDGSTEQTDGETGTEENETVAERSEEVSFLLQLIRQIDVFFQSLLR